MLDARHGVEDKLVLTSTEFLGSENQSVGYNCAAKVKSYLLGPLNKLSYNREIKSNNKLAYGSTTLETFKQKMILELIYI